eukprot:8567997-Pyramimonas_sp.AAC.1
MRTSPLGPSVELGHETLYWVGWTHADVAMGACGGAPFGDTKQLSGWGRKHANVATVALGGAPYGATKR